MVWASIGWEEAILSTVLHPSHCSLVSTPTTLLLFYFLAKCLIYLLHSFSFLFLPPHPLLSLPPVVSYAGPLLLSSPQPAPPSFLSCELFGQPRLNILRMWQGEREARRWPDGKKGEQRGRRRRWKKVEEGEVWLFFKFQRCRENILILNLDDS